jgi:hypothetical protein
MRENLPTPAEVKHVLQQAVLRNYPNPERKGCPGTNVLQDIAQLPLPPESDPWMHIVHCSPCYRDFLDFRHAVLRKRRRHRWISRLLYAILAIAIVLTLMYAVRRG